MKFNFLQNYSMRRLFRLLIPKRMVKILKVNVYKRIDTLSLVHTIFFFFPFQLKFLNLPSKNSNR